MNPIVARVIREFFATRLQGRPLSLTEAKLMLHDQLPRACQHQVKPWGITKQGRQLCQELRRFVRRHCGGIEVAAVMTDHGTRTGGLPLSSVITDEIRAALARAGALSRDDYLVMMASAMLICRIFDQLDERVG